MRSYYQVVAGFKLSKGKPSLISLSFHTVDQYFLFLVPENSSLSYSRFFYSVPEARHYIKYLYCIYPSCSIPYPVLSDSTVVSIRRLASVMGLSLLLTIEVLIRASQGFIDSKKVCEKCKFNNHKIKCVYCVFNFKMKFAEEFQPILQDMEDIE